jgi:phage terminase small subunit
MAFEKRESTAKPVTEKYQRGRKSQTPAIRAARGRPLLKAKEKPAGMQVEPCLVDPPEMLDDAGRKEWQRVGRYLLKLRRVSALDLQSLAVYCTSLSVFGEAIRPLLIEREPLWGYVAGRAKPNVLSSVALRHAEIVLDVATKFGLTARTRHLDHADTGRPLVPDELHEMRGNPSKKKLGRTKAAERIGQWDAEDVDPPFWIDRDRVARAEWMRLVDQFENLELWTPLDVGPMAVGCGCFALIAKCAKQFQSQPLTLPLQDAEGCVEHPLSVIYGKHWRVCESVWKEYGLSPVDRVRFPGAVAEVAGKPKLSVYLA